MILKVAYDLHNPGRDYPAIEKMLKAVDGSWAHPQGSVWLLDTLRSPETWVKALTAAGDKNDEYLVCRLQGNWASVNMDKGVVDWLNDSRRRW